MLTMRTFDFGPLYRSAVGFDRLADLLETATKSEAAGGYPPYNIETIGEDAEPDLISTRRGFIASGSSRLRSMLSRPSAS